MILELSDVGQALGLRRALSPPGCVTGWSEPYPPATPSSPCEAQITMAKPTSPLPNKKEPQQ